MNYNILQDRMISLSVSVLNFSKGISKSYEGNYLKNQLIRSINAGALNYAEARSAESRKDFIHKLRICLKEYRESQVALRIIRGANLIIESDSIESVEKECSEIIAIIQSSISTAQKKKVN